MKKTLFIVGLVAVFVAGCVQNQPSVETKNGVYKGELRNIKLRQNTKAEITVNADVASVEFTDLTEQEKPCKMTLNKTNSQIAGVTSYEGSFAEAVGVCRIFVQDPKENRFMHLRAVGNEIEVTFAYDKLAKKPIIAGYLK